MTLFNYIFLNIVVMQAVHNAKRCGIIFVAKDILKNYPDKYSFLVVRGTTGIYSFPKGRMNEKESEEECAIREVYEETGIKIPLSLVSSLPRIRIGSNIYFICHTEQEAFSNFTIYDTGEVDEVEWKNIKQLFDLDCNKDIRAVLRYPYQVRIFHRKIFAV